MDLMQVIMGYLIFKIAVWIRTHRPKQGMHLTVMDIFRSQMADHIYFSLFWQVDMNEYTVYGTWKLIWLMHCSSHYWLWVLPSGTTNDPLIQRLLAIHYVVSVYYWVTACNLQGSPLPVTPWELPKLVIFTGITHSKLMPCFVTFCLYNFGPETVILCSVSCNY